MSRKEYLRMTYDSYFDRLNSLAKHIEALKEISKKVSGEQKQALETHITILESEFESYAKYLSETGIQVIKNVA